MKAPGTILLILALVFCIGCSNNPTNDPEVINQVFVSYFDGIKNNDRKKMTDAIAADFLLYENGHAWNNDSVYMNMERNAPYTVQFKFDNIKIAIDGKLGHMTYDEHANFVFQDTITTNLKFLGRAAFRKDNGKWKMYFLQATEKYVAKRNE